LGGINTAKWRHFEIHNILDRLAEGEGGESWATT
jgi:hypothetical protein